MAAAMGKNSSKKTLSSIIKKKAPATSTATQEELRHMIAEAAYYRAQARGFNGDLALDDWLAAEAQISAQAAQQRQ
ncbi:MAG: DUF2934 domain-containing protein [Candidatus Lambdaproteobacteria bacterium]|nr:DUF2934 domain-containing protein [Candidatus Lambdaproteobacteria bacterium]